MSSKDKEEIIGRRLFFKKAAKTAIPLLAGMAVMPNLISCSKDMSIEDAILQGETGCSYSCSNSCSSSCGTACTNSSSSGGCSSCGNGCSNGCGSTCSSDCGSACSSGCGSACSNNCQSGCGNSCSNNASNTSEPTVSNATGSVDGHEYVDLGLSVKWARCNIGAQSPEKYGTYDFVPFHYLSSSRKDTLSQQYWYIDNYVEFAGNVEFDIGAEKWGGSWHAPSYDNWIELKNNCDREKIVYGGKTGMKFTSRINGKSIFIPLTGEKCKSDNFQLKYEGVTANYPTSTYFCGHGSMDARFISLFSVSEVYYGNDDIMVYIRAVTTGSGNPSGCNNSCSNSATNNGCANCSSNCASDCTNQCEGLCGGSGCTSTCGGSCDEKCVSCTYSCQNIASGACSGCTANCSSFCSQTCKSMCYHVSWG